MTHLYVSGPMTGHEDYNRPAFAKATLALRSKGYVVTSPGETPLNPSWTWKEYMRNNLRLLSFVDGVALLDGWVESKGCKLELRIADDLEMPAWKVGDWMDYDFITKVSKNTPSSIGENP